MTRKFFQSLRSNNGGAIMIEFALLAPVLITLMVGVFHTGVYMQNYNAIRSLTSDGARHTMIEYQKGNEITNEQLRTVLVATATNAPYLLDSDRLTVTVSDVTLSRVSGADEVKIDVSYTLEDWLPFVTLPGSTLSYTRPVFVVSAPVVP